MKLTIIFSILIIMFQEQLSNLFDFKNAENIRKWSVVGRPSYGRSISGENDT